MDLTKTRKWALAIAACALLLLSGFADPGTVARAQAQPGARYFSETGHTVKGRFLEYWETHGGLLQQGYPLSDELREVSDTDGRTYTVQYFERAVFEYHPENQPPYDVLLALLGAFAYNQRYGVWGSPNPHTSTVNPITFPQTGKTLGGLFRTYWETHGGLQQQGYPVSNLPMT